ncbi:MAG: ABC transporter permease [Gammaproteobacteria bacterium]|nr:ABC transporter permease [Gammaproteobacteria bacterium]
MKTLRLSAITPPLVSFMAIALGLEIGLAAAEVPTYLLPRPSAVWLALADNWPELLRATSQTALAAFLGLSLSALLGGFTAIVLSSHTWIRRAFYPYAVFFQTVPVVAIAPMLVIWFGYGIRAITAAAFIVSVFPIIANTLSGLLSTDPALRDLFRIYRASPLATLFKLRIPSALPYFLTGLRIASGLAVIGAIVGEFVADTYQGGGGIGTAVEVAIKEQKTDKVFAAVTMASILGLAFFALVNLASYVSMRRWQLAETKE